MERAQLAVVVPTLNEEKNLTRCLDSVDSWVTQIVVVDSGSEDSTTDLAKARGAQVVRHGFTSHPEQWDWILKNVSFETEWVLALDADQSVTGELRDSIRAALETPDGVDGFYLKHRQIFLGRFIRHGGIYPRPRLHLFRLSAVQVNLSQRVDAHFEVAGRTRTLEGDLVEDNRKEDDFGFWIEKQVSYARRAALDEVEGEATSGDFRHRNGRVYLARRIWRGLPLYWRSVGYFIYRYVLRFGFLDGREGFLYHFSQALLHRVLLDAGVDPHRYLKQVPDP